MTYGNRHLSFPFRIGPKGRPVQVTSIEEHVRDELVQLVFTNPGERLFLPEFGGGLQHLVFRAFDDSTVDLTKAALTENLVKWFGDRIMLDEVELEAKNETIYLKLGYRIKDTDERRELKFQKRL